ncbi:MAG: hypothetical protein M1837_003127 [Sclerophora amabilis]|nr:MAG: hypothetical protein M1837_003127 [Sclerophora amabilis]
MTAERTASESSQVTHGVDSKASDPSPNASDSQTAAEFIHDQLQLEADAREALPYAFDTCTQPLGPLRQILFSCLTCNPPPSSSSESYTPAGVCYSCSIACHGEHTLVELFNKRDFVCDCGTSRLPSKSPCTLRINTKTGTKGNVHSETPASGNNYNHNFKNRFCGCGKVYDAFQEEGTMYQCLGLSTADQGGCGEDWWHPSCVVGLEPDWYVRRKDGPDGVEAEHLSSATHANHQVVDPQNGVRPVDETDQHDVASDGEVDPPTPAGFPAEDDFESFICYKCVEANPWIKKYAGADGFLPPVLRHSTISGGKNGNETQDLQDSKASGEPTDEVASQESSSKKRKANDEMSEDPPSPKKHRNEHATGTADAKTESLAMPSQECYYNTLTAATSEPMSLFLKEGFQTRFCRCQNCFKNIAKFPQLLEEESSYEPPLSEEDDDDEGRGSSVGTGSLLNRGERALSNVDRVRAIEGVMVYNHLKEKVKDFLKPFADNGQAVGAEDIKQYFEQLRGDTEAMKSAGARLSGDGPDGEGDNREEQSGY